MPKMLLFVKPSGGGGGGGVDPYGENVSLLLHMNGANGSTSFTDSSLNNFAVTRFGDAQISTTQSKYGGAAGYFTAGSGPTPTGTKSWLTTPAPLLNGNSAYVVEAWVYLDPPDYYKTVYSTRVVNTGSSFGFTDTNEMFAYSDATGGLSSGAVVPHSQWVHVAWSYDGTNFRMFINGNKVYEQPKQLSHGAGSYVGRASIFENPNYGEFFEGYMDDLRITNGVARYISNFTPPAAQFPDPVVPPDPYGADVSLLLHMNGSNGSTTFTDSSLNNFTVTRFGDAQISTTQSKYGGAAGHFDGNGDYLEIADNDAFELQGDDFTIECWINVTSLKGYQAIANKSYNTTDQHGWLLYFETNPPDVNEINFLVGNGSWSVILQSNFTPSLSTWYHVAVSRSGNTWRLFVDGDLKASTTNSIVMNTGNLPMYIGRYPHFPGANLNQTFEGYIDDFRITKGVARYTSNFTPPTAEFPNP